MRAGTLQPQNWTARDKRWEYWIRHAFMGAMDSRAAHVSHLGSIKCTKNQMHSMKVHISPKSQQFEVCKFDCLHCKCRGSIDHELITAG